MMESREFEELKAIVKECNLYINWEKVVAVTRMYDTDRIAEYQVITCEGADFNLMVNKEKRFGFIRPTKTIKTL